MTVLVPDQDDRFHDALADYLLREDSGEEIDRAEFAARHPEFAAPFAAYFENVSLLDALAGPPAGKHGRAWRSAESHEATLAKSGDSTGGGSMPGQTPGAIPKTFGRYQILKELGQGAMGAVYLAHDTQLDRNVALKIPKFPEAEANSKQGAAERAALLERFYREARAAAKLRHPNLCPVHDVGEIGGRHYITMAFIEGRPLKDFARSKKAQPERQVATVIRKLALGLAEAHAHGIVHRDLKPANVMVDAKGEPVVMDFGLAQRTSTTDVQLTQSGAILGTPAYMSPEQVAGDQAKVGPASDIYGLGVIFYEVLTGQVPFGGGLMSILLQIATEQPKPPSALRPGLDPRLEAICLKMMAKQPAQRYAAMNEVAQALADYLASSRAGSGHQEQPLAASGTHTPRAADISALETGSIPLQPRPRTRRHSLGLSIAVGAVALGGLLILGAVTLFLRLGNVDVKVEIDDPSLAVKFDKETVTFAGSGQPIRLRPGQHKFIVERDGLETETDSLTVKKNGKNVLRVSLVDGQIAIASDGQPLRVARRHDIPTRSQRGEKSNGWRDWSADAPLPAIAPFDADQAERHQNAWAKHLGVPVEYENSIGMKLVLIPPGEFTMGMSREEAEAIASLTPEKNDWQLAALGSSPPHRVCVTQPFYVGAHEVTQGQYEEVMGDNPSAFSTRGQGSEEVDRESQKQHPVESVSFLNAAEFCVRLSKRELLVPAYSQTKVAVGLTRGGGYRLPTEAEWEMACRGGTTTDWYCGDKEGALKTCAWYHCGQTPHAVGQLRANQFGLFDMHGNVWELCQDWHDAKAYEQSARHSLTVDPMGPANGSQRVLRGGACPSWAVHCRSSFRFHVSVLDRFSDRGFRVRLSVDAVKQLQNESN